MISPRSVTFAGFVFVLVAYVVTLGQAVFLSQKFYGHQSPHAISLLFARYLIALFGLIPLGICLYRFRRKRVGMIPDFTSWKPVRIFLYSIFLAIVTSSLVASSGLLGSSRFLLEQSFIGILLLTLGLWTLGLQIDPALLPSGLRRAFGTVDIVLANLLLGLVVAEAALSVASRYSTSPLFLDTPSIAANLEKARPRPHQRYFGFSLNSGGYHDTEFTAAGPEDYVVSMLADSFGLGVVPYEYNFATIAEKRLRQALAGRFKRVEIHNHGLPAIGMQEYAHLIRTEVLDLNPSCVALCVYVGNDISGSERRKTKRYKLQNWWVWIVGSRVLTVLWEPDEGASLGKIGEPVPAEELALDYIHDPTKEPPSLSEETFLRIEGEHLESLAPSNGAEERYQDFFHSLETIHNLVGDKLVVILIPDEFQVSDALYEKLISKNKDLVKFDRQSPQQRVRAYGNKNGIPVLDLMPALLEAEKGGRTYHLRDTHWNAHGNRIAGEQVAAFLLQRLSVRKDEPSEK